MKKVTKGVSPKVYLPTAALATVGVVLILLGHDQEGQGVLGAALAPLLIGSAAKPGDVVVEDVDAIDMSKSPGIS
jgi:hypothetical protein